MDRPRVGMTPENRRGGFNTNTERAAMTTAAIEPWAKLIKNVGFPIAAFLLLFFSVREGVVWVGTKVVEPAVDAHVELVGSLQAAVKEQTEMQRENAQTNASTAESVKKLSEVQAEQTHLLKEALKGT